MVFGERTRGPLKVPILTRLLAIFLMTGPMGLSAFRVSAAVAEGERSHRVECYGRALTGEPYADRAQRLRLGRVFRLCRLHHRDQATSTVTRAVPIRAFATYRKSRAMPSSPN